MSTVTEATAGTELNLVVADDLTEIARRSDARIQRFSGRRVLVTGGAGFLPSYIVDALAHLNATHFDAPCRIVVADNFLTGLPSRLAHRAHDPHIEFVEADVIRGLPDVGPVDHIIHAAGVASPTWYRRYPLETIDVNVTGTRQMLEVARRQEVQGFLYLSTSEVYGDPPPERIPTAEDYRGNVSCTGPRACYDESKRLGETLCMTYHDQFAVPAKVVRPFNVYGPRLRLDDGRVVPDLIRDALAGHPITLYSDGTATRSFCYVTDAVLAILMLLADDVVGEAFNVGNDEEVTIRHLAETVARVAGNVGPVRFEASADPDYLVDNPQRRCPDLTRTKAAIAPWEPAVDLSAGIERTYRSYREE